MTFRAMAQFLRNLGGADGLLTLVLASAQDDEWAVCVRDNVQGHLHWIVDDPAHDDAHLYTSPRPIARISGLPVDAPYTWSEVQDRLDVAYAPDTPWRITRIAIGDGHLLQGDRYAIEIRPHGDIGELSGNDAVEVKAADETMLLEDNGMRRVLRGLSGEWEASR